MPSGHSIVARRRRQSADATLRRLARRRGVQWAAVLAAYDRLREEERIKREHANEVRQTAWMLATCSTPGSWPFWRHGFRARFGRRVDLHDFTAIAGYDEIGQEIATRFPEYAHDRGTEELFEFLLSPYDRLPTRAELLRKAIEEAEWEAIRAARETDADRQRERELDALEF